MFVDDGKVAPLAKVFEKQAEKDRESRKELFQAINKTLQEGFATILKKPPVVINFPNAKKEHIACGLEHILLGHIKKIRAHVN